MKVPEFVALLKWMYTGKIDPNVSTEPFSDAAFSWDVFNLAFALKNSGGASTAHSWNLETLFNSERYSDVTFIIGNKRIHGHKVILGSRCSYFGTLFTSSLLLVRSDTL
jgi:hypothetical protein